MRSTGTRRALNRRKFIALGGASLAAPLLITRQPALAQSGELRVANWGGDWNERVVVSSDTGVSVFEFEPQVREVYHELAAPKADGANAGPAKDS